MLGFYRAAARKQVYKTFIYYRCVMVKRWGWALSMHARARARAPVGSVAFHLAYQVPVARALVTLRQRRGQDGGEVHLRASHIPISRAQSANHHQTQARGRFVEESAFCRGEQVMIGAGFTCTHLYLLGGQAPHERAALPTARLGHRAVLCPPRHRPLRSPAHHPPLGSSAHAPRTIGPA